MHFDVKQHLGAVERSVSSPAREGRAARTVTLSRSYPTDIQELWDAITRPDRIPRWFLPISGDFEPGGRYQFEGNAGGEIEACEPPSRLELTWEFGEFVSWVEVRVSEDGADRARLTLTHIQHASDHWSQYGAGATGVGWEMGLLGLALHLADPAAPKPDTAEFAVLPDGRALLVGSSEAWGEAAIAGGTDPDTARARAGRTTAFYTGSDA